MAKTKTFAEKMNKSLKSPVTHAHYQVISWGKGIKPKYRSQFVNVPVKEDISNVLGDVLK